MDGVAVIPESPGVEIRCAAIPDAVEAVLGIGVEHLGSPAMVLGDDTWRWQWIARGRIGAFTVRLSVVLRDGSHHAHEARLVVEPGKVTRDEYERLLEDVQRVSYALVFALGGGMVSATEAAGHELQTLISGYWSRLSRQAALATAIVRAITRSPRHALRQIVQDRALADVVEAPPRLVEQLAARPLDAVPSLRSMPGLPHSRAGVPLAPRTLRVSRTGIDSSIYEHELLLRTLRDLRWRCHYVRAAVRRELAWRKAGAAGSGELVCESLCDWEARIGRVIRELDRAAAADFLAGVEPARQFRGVTDLMRRDRRYRAIGRLWTSIAANPFVALHSPAYDLPSADLPRLYELWCVLSVAEVLARRGPFVEQRLLVPETVSYAGLPGVVWTLRLAEDEPLLRAPLEGGGELALFYQRRYRPMAGQQRRLGSLDPFLRIPDIAIEIARPDEAPRVLILDAKYRVAPSGGVPEDALADVYAYAAAVGFAGTGACLGSYVLFPGQHGFEAGAVGALPCAPGRVEWLGDLLERCFGRS